MYRSNYTDKNNVQPPSITVYTVFTPEEAYFGFWIGLLIFCLTTFKLKTCVSTKFQKAHIWTKLQHTIEMAMVPDAFGEWDSLEDNDIKLSWMKHLKETAWMIFLHLISNIILLTPVFIAGLFGKTNFLPDCQF